MSWSGGKDSMLALSRLRASHSYAVVGLLTSVTRAYDRVSIHGVRRELLQQQAASLALPLFELSLDADTTNERYEAAFHEALAAVRAIHPTLRHMAFGDLYLRDVRAYRERLLESTGVSPLFPLWDVPTRALADEFIASGYRATVVCTDDEQVSPAFAGREYDASFLSELPATADPCGENGEFHTFVRDGPLFAQPVLVRKGDIVRRDGRFTYCDLLAE